MKTKITKSRLTLLLCSIFVFLGCQKESITTLEKPVFFTKINPQEASIESSKLLENFYSFNTCEKELFKFEDNFDAFLSESVLDFGSFSKIFSGKFKIFSRKQKTKKNNVYEVLSLLPKEKSINSLPKELIEASMQTLIIDKKNKLIYGDLKFNNESITLSSTGGKNEVILIKHKDVSTRSECSTKKEYAFHDDDLEKQINQNNNSTSTNKSKPTIKTLFLFSHQTFIGNMLRTYDAFFSSIMKFMLSVYIESDIEVAIKNEFDFDIVIDWIERAANSNSSSDEFNWFASSDVVSLKRHFYSADLVQYVAPSGANWSGAGSLIGWASIVVEDSYLTGCVSLHEFGHNFGMHHDWNNSPSVPTTGCNHGTIIRTVSQANPCFYSDCFNLYGIAFSRTIMSYYFPGAHTRVKIFSDPNLNTYTTHYGGTCDSPGRSTGEVSPSYNFNQIKTRKHIVANYK